MVPKSMTPVVLKVEVLDFTTDQRSGDKLAIFRRSQQLRLQSVIAYPVQST